MATHFWIDNTDKTRKIYDRLIEKFFPKLKGLSILLTMRDSEKTDDEGNIIVAEAKKISTRERDLWGPDCEVCMDANIWAKSNLVDKYRIAFHELSHFRIETDKETGEVKLDGNNRYKIALEKHDIMVKTFKREIEIFGLDGTDKEVADFMAEILSDDTQVRTNKKKFLGKLGIEINGPTEKKKKKKKKKKKSGDEITLSTKKKNR